MIIEAMYRIIYKFHQLRISKCNVYSFDPFIEPPRVEKIRSSLKSNENSLIIDINPKWKFINAGLAVHSNVSDINQFVERKSMLSFNDILEFLKF